MATIGVYAVRNTATGGMYVGSSKDLRGRWWSHRSALRLGKHNNQRLQRTWNKYDEAAFEFIILEELGSEAELFTAEQAWIDQLRLDGVELYNNRKYAWTNRNITMPESMRRKLSEQMKGKPLPPEAYQNSLVTQNRLRADPEYLACVAAKLNSPESRAKRGRTIRGRPKPKRVIAALNSPQAIVKREASRTANRSIVLMRAPDGTIHEIQNFAVFARSLGWTTKQGNSLANVALGLRRIYKGWTAPAWDSHWATRKRIYRLRAPDGTIHEIENLAGLARQQGWSNSVGLTLLTQGKIKSHKGWTLVLPDAMEE